jgi:hypothetical protein
MLDLFHDWELMPGQRVVLLGSCFSDNLGPYLERADYHVYSNPFGTLFHPIPIMNWIDMAISEEVGEERLQMIYHENQWKSLCGGKELKDNSKEMLLERIHRKRSELRAELEEAEVLVLTLGTAHAWVHEEYGIVGNCQRLPNANFQRKLISVEEMSEAVISVLNKLNRVNPFLQVVLTISPVKHWRMGVVENSRTKARLVELVHALRVPRLLSYFPSYEYVTDVLRSDEYFNSDRCHPNQRAIELVAQAFLRGCQEKWKIIKKNNE